MRNSDKLGTHWVHGLIVYAPPKPNNNCLSTPIHRRLKEMQLICNFKSHCPYHEARLKVRQSEKIRGWKWLAKMKWTISSLKHFGFILLVISKLQTLYKTMKFTMFLYPRIQIREKKLILLYRLFVRRYAPCAKEPCPVDSKGFLKDVLFRHHVSVIDSSRDKLNEHLSYQSMKIST